VRLGGAIPARAECPLRASEDGERDPDAEQRGRDPVADRLLRVGNHAPDDPAHALELLALRGVRAAR
jgi:hypothetical protein